MINFDKNDNCDQKILLIKFFKILLFYFYSSNVRRDSDDTSEEDDDESEEEEEEQENLNDSKESKETLETKVSKEDQQKKRPARKTKEAATVFLNMVGQKLCKKGKEDDEISIESLNESTQVKRLEQAEKQKAKDQQQTKKPNTISSLPSMFPST